MQEVVPGVSSVAAAANRCARILEDLRLTCSPEQPLTSLDCKQSTGRLAPPSRWLQAGSSLKDCLTMTDCITFQDSIPTGHVLRFRSNLLPHRFTSDKELRNQLCRKLISKLTSSLQTSSIYIQNRYCNGIVMVQ